MSDASNPNPDWYPDPTGRFEQRYWDGAQWTEHVSSAGQQRTDPLPGAEPEVSTGEDLPSLGDLSQGAGLIEPTPDTTPPPGWGDSAPAAAEPTPAAEPVQPEPAADPAPAAAFVDAGQAVAAAPVASGPAPDWYGDPTGRYEQRYWDGTAWTEHVTAAGQQGIDPLPDAEGASSDQSDQTGQSDQMGQSDQAGAAAEEGADVGASAHAGENPFAAAAEPAPVAEATAAAPGSDEPSTEGSDDGAGLPPVPGIDSPGVGSAVPPAASVPVASAAPPPVDAPGDPATSVMPPAADPSTEAMPAADPASPEDDDGDDGDDGDDEEPPDEGPGDGGGGPGPAPDPAPQPAPAAAGPAPDWYPDPTGRQELRYWDGVQWTEHGSSGGHQVVDPIGQATNLAKIPVGDSDAAKVQQQVQQKAGVTPTIAGGGSLFTEPILVVNQKWKLIEIENEYAVYDQNGNQIGAVRQVGQSTAKKVARVLTSFDQFMTHSLQVVDMAGTVQLTMTRPAKFVKSRVEIGNGVGQSVGSVVQQNAIGKIRFSLEAGGHNYGSINAENWRAWNFNIQDHTGAEVARISKTWEGLAKTMFTTADNYVLQIHRPLEDPLRTLVVASALCVDTALKQDSRGLG